ncbi:hypothetical protein OK351_03810 [Glutamicibacter sp. MNS18]|uniref:hypothetical protein n=1 Tax=Glutamicibacter sp. MNS18 TaxID=2989817 RepID=UPI0022361DF5|nr:hypothetical protein [Glutamicibacter sp. MNS18]MCW4464634.1 hypothetical protein [Glutamicibacter sp. MNS18]
MENEFLWTVLEVPGLLIGRAAPTQDDPEGFTCCFWEPSKMPSDIADEVLDTMGYSPLRWERLEGAASPVFVVHLSEMQPTSASTEAVGNAVYLGEAAPDIANEDDVPLDFTPLIWTPPRTD